MFKVIIDHPEKRKVFEETLQKFLTGNYGSFEEFQNTIKETLGITTDRLALEAYTQFTSIIYDKEILNKIILLSEDQISSSNQIKKLIEEDVEKLHHRYNTNYDVFKKQILEVRDQFYEDCGLYRLVPNYFEEDYADIEKDLNNWINSFSFTHLHSIKENKEFRRQKVVEEIKKRLVAVDNVNNERTSAIFYVMDQLYSQKRNDIKFLLTARIPEFNRFIQGRLGTVQEEKHRDSINKFILESNEHGLLKYELGFFTEEDIRYFMTKYKELIHLKSKSL
jgi:hypothetical protein